MVFDVINNRFYSKGKSGYSVSNGRKLIDRPAVEIDIECWMYLRPEKVLSAKYQLETPIEATSLENINEDQLVVDKFSKGGFFSYNIGGRNVGGNN
jgi:hypothetical protein